MAALFGDSAPKIVCTSPSVTIDLSSSTNKSFTVYDYNLPKYVLHRSPITGKRTPVYQGVYAAWEITVWNLSADDWNDTYKLLNGVTATFYPHADVAAESVAVFVLTHPYKRDNLIEMDAVKISIVSIDYYSPTEH